VRRGGKNLVDAVGALFGAVVGGIVVKVYCSERISSELKSKGQTTGTAPPKRFAPRAS
jgi:hypothetical protein